jgi:hypothetical protein
MLLCLIMVCMGISGAIAGAGNNKAADETLSVRDAARTYLEGEVRGDLDAVWRMLAPSSFYVKTHSYEEYLDHARLSPVRVVEYRILAVSGVSKNQDRRTHPGIQSFARVEVELKLYSRDTNTHDIVNIEFTFVKERNRWYKG